MKGLAGLAALLGISMLLNAIEGQWAFDFSKTETKWILADLLIAVALFGLSYELWSRARVREAEQSIADRERMRQQDRASREKQQEDSKSWEQPL